MTFAVPVVDISPYVRGGSAEERAAVAAAMDEARGSRAGVVNPEAERDAARVLAARA
ncbi:hypothetical protein [Modestobacter marinus]|uniref:hypothetical protein n=1 Tax=Modestobacter marinus TaxID=477641 RepID=UPI001C97C7DD|nr:hypothetical protein [Modestobacter marinus]